MLGDPEFLARYPESDVDQAGLQLREAIAKLGHLFGGNKSILHAYNLQSRIFGLHDGGGLVCNFGRSAIEENTVLGVRGVAKELFGEFDAGDAIDAFSVEFEVENDACTIGDNEFCAADNIPQFWPGPPLHSHFCVESDDVGALMVLKAIFESLGVVGEEVDGDGENGKLGSHGEKQSFFRLYFRRC